MKSPIVKTRLQSVTEIAIASIGILFALTGILDGIDKAFDYFTLYFAIILSCIIIPTYLIVLYLINRNKVKWVSKDGYQFTVKRLSKRITLILIISLILLWVPWIINSCIFNSKQPSGSNPPIIPLFASNNKDYKILILPFYSECQYNGKQYDVGYIVKERLNYLNTRDQLNTSTIYYQVPRSIANINDKYLDSICAINNADIIIYGAYSLSECDFDSIDKLSFRYLVNVSTHEFGIYDKSDASTLVEFYGINDLRGGVGQGNLDYILYYLNGVKSYYKRNYTETIRYLSVVKDNKIDKGNLNYFLALSYEKLKNNDEADYYYKRALHKNQLDPLVNDSYATFLRYNKGDIQLALVYYLKSLAIDSSIAIVNNNYATLLGNELNNKKEALKYYRKAISLDSTNSLILVNYASLLSSLKFNSEANKYFKMALSGRDISSRVYFEYGGYLYNNGGNKDSVSKYILKAIEMDSLNVHYIHSFGVFNFNFGNYDLSNKYYEKSLGLDSLYSTFEYAHLQYDVFKNYQTGYKYYKKYLLRDPNDFVSIAKCAEYELMIQNNIRFGTDKYLDSMVNKLNEAIKLNPNYYLPHLLLGAIMYNRFKKYDIARSYLECAIELDQTFANANSYKLYSIIMLQVYNNFDVAKKAYIKAIQLNPINREAICDSIFQIY